LIVTTPSAIALEDVRRGVEMFRQTEVPLIGLVENMSYFSCDKCGHDEAIFGEGGGEATARQLDIPYLGQVPLDPLVGRQADAGEPIVLAHPDAASSQALLRLAGDVNSYFQSA
jgi:ATP-binding protein involved in chromosome partitioning